jgi:ubiquinone/menaquinone biosynthesis C-methylase UbiE
MAPSIVTKSLLDHFNQNAASYEAGTGGCTRGLAHHILDLLSNVDNSSVILDNACGTGIVAANLLLRLESLDVGPTLHLVDGAPNMVNIARQRIGQLRNVHYSKMTAEKLDFPTRHSPILLQPGNSLLCRC